MEIFKEGPYLNKRRLKIRYFFENKKSWFQILKIKKLGNTPRQKKNQSR